jgi:hypothetical protein
MKDITYCIPVVKKINCWGNTVSYKKPNERSVQLVWSRLRAIQFRCKLAVGIFCAGVVSFVCDSRWQGVRYYFVPALCEAELCGR